MTIARLLTAFVLTISSAVTATAQSMFSPVVHVNDSIVTYFELEQRIKLMTVLNQPGNVEDEALQSLIENSLAMQEARKFGFSIPQADIDASLDQFAARANLTAPELLSELEKLDIAPETVYYFLRATNTWRAIVGGRYGSTVQVTEAEVDRAISQASSQGGISVRVAEIIIPIQRGFEDQALNLAERLATVSDFEEFSDAAREYSVAPSAAEGGDLGWTALSELPGQMGATLLTLSPGDTTGVIEGPNALRIYQMRGVTETSAPRQNVLAMEYATYTIPGGQSAEARAEAQRIRNAIDVCDDLYGVNFGQPPERLNITSSPLREIPGAYRNVLASMDEGEADWSLTSENGQMIFLMLCGRVTAQTEDLSREEIRDALRNQRLTSYAESYMAQLLSEARITYP